VNIIVVRPSERAAEEEGKRSYEQIKQDKVARGFAAGPEQAGGCQTIWVVRDDGEEAFSADVIDAQLSAASRPGKTRSDIRFGNPTIFKKEDIPAAIAGIAWTSNNVRYDP
jgi:hypothetical protein